MKKIFILALLFVVMSLTTACGAVNSLNSLSERDNFKAVNSLWSDVPAMDGLGKPVEAELPTSIKLIMRAGVNLVIKGLGEGSPEWDWITFSTNKTPADLKKFYTTARMASSPYNWASDASGCLSGEQSFAQDGAFCAFTKQVDNKQIGLLIITAQDERKQETSVFFLRGESTATPVAKNAPAAVVKPTQGAIRMLNGPAPYGIEKRPMPDGLDLEKLLPKQVGPYIRVLLEKSEQRGVTPSFIEIDGNSVYATYRAGANEIFLEFAVSSSAENAQDTLRVAAGDAAGGAIPTDPRFGSMGTEPAYLLVSNADGAFFAWTRGGYYFSVNAKNGQNALDAFMQAFPY